MKSNFLVENVSKEAEEIFKKTTVAVVPWGCIHEHGPTPIGIDYLAVYDLANRLKDRTNAVVLPPIPFGWVEDRTDFPGTITVNQECLYQMVLDVCRSLNKWGIRKIVFLNGHGGNMGILARVGAAIREELNMIGGVINWWALVPQLNQKYAGPRSTEPTVALGINPRIIDPSKSRIRVYKQKTFFGNEMTVGPKEVKFRGATIPIVGMRQIDVEEDGLLLGKEVTAEDGNKILQIVANYIIDFIEELEKVEAPRRAS
jgi:creatinine amidohydrolase